MAAAEAQSAALLEDLAVAHQLIGKLRADLQRSLHENKWLRHRLDVLSRRLFGRKAEQLTPGQLVLAYEHLENETGKADEPVETDSGEGLTLPRSHVQFTREESPGSSAVGTEGIAQRFPRFPQSWTCPQVGARRPPGDAVRQNCAA